MLIFYATKTFPIDEAFYQMYVNKEKFENMKKNIDLIRKPNATRDVCEFLVNLDK